MAKDPAFLFYPGDWQGGTSTFTRHLKGCYIDILIAQFNNGHLSLEEIKTILGSDFGQHWPTLRKKFKQDKDGLFFNVKLDTEMTRRKEYSESRRKNRQKKTHDTTYVKHMSGHMETETETGSLGVTITTTAREVFFNDLPNSSALDTIAMDLKLSKQQVLDKVPGFRMAAETDYPTFKDFCRHLKNWIRKNPTAAEGRLVR